MRIHHNICIGHVETINLDVYENESLLESKVVVLKLEGNDKNNLPKYRPLRKYKEYYRLNKVEPLSGFVSDSMINQAIQKTGKQEVKQLSKVA